MAIKVSLREKPIQGNKISLYLDFYPKINHSKTGRPTRREFLNLFLESEIEYKVELYEDKNKKQQRRITPVLSYNNKPKKRYLTILQKENNRKIWDQAEQRRNNRENEVNKPEVYSDFEREKIEAKELGKGNFVEYFKSLSDSKTGNAKRNWYIVYKYLNDFTQGKVSFNDLNKRWCENFRSYIEELKSYNSDNPLKQNSRAAYFTKFKTALNKAFKEGYIQINLSASVAPIKVVDTQRNFLTLEELNRLAKADCPWPMLKKAFLFSSLTGLRYSDIIALYWRNIETIDNKIAIRYTQKKTQSIDTLWISKSTYEILGEAGNPDEKIFPKFHLTSTNSRYLDRWLGNAQITKHITYHSSRHTFACLQISLGSSIYKVKDLLGHKSIKSTEVYAKIMDKDKQAAAELIKLDL